MLTTVGNSPSVVRNQSSNEAVRISTLLAAIDARISRMQSAYLQLAFDSQEVKFR